MRTKKRNINKFATVVTYILIIALILSVIGFLAYFSSGFSDDFKSFYLRYEGKLIMQNKSDFLLKPLREYKFYTVYTLGFLTKQKPKYTVKVKPAAGVNFEYTVDGDFYIFSALTDLTAYFDIKAEEDYFTVSSSVDLPSLFNKIYPDKTVVLPDFEDKDYFALIVASGKESITINFSMSIFVKQITIDKEYIIL